MMADRKCIPDTTPVAAKHDGQGRVHLGRARQVAMTSAAMVAIAAIAAWPGAAAPMAVYI
jgi:hypothetical protein